jgi:hypothetical protein
LVNESVVLPAGAVRVLGEQALRVLVASDRLVAAAAPAGPKAKDPAPPRTHRAARSAARQRCRITGLIQGSSELADLQYLH